MYFKDTGANGFDSLDEPLPDGPDLFTESSPEGISAEPTVADHEWLIVHERESQPDAQAADSPLDQPATPIERITDTAVGPITIIKPRDTTLPYDAYDLADFLSSYDPNKLPQLGERADSGVAIAPSDDDVVLRWNTRGQKERFALPDAPEALTDYTVAFEREIDRVRQYGTHILNRNVFIVEKDEHHANQPTVYTATERHYNSRPLRGIFDFFDDGEITEDVEFHLTHCNTASEYLLATPPGTPFIFDNLVYPHQYGGLTLFDYDIYLQHDDTMRFMQLGKVERWIKGLPKSTEQQRLLSEVSDALSERQRRGRTYGV